MANATLAAVKAFITVIPETIGVISATASGI
jgi:hypothetical protein